MRRWVGIVGIFLLLLALGLWWQTIIVHASQETGTSDSASRAYDYWSGFGSVFPWSLAILGGIVAAYRHHSCHVKGCPRLGKPVEGTPYAACPRHHPAHDGDKRGVAVEEIHRAFHERRK